MRHARDSSTFLIIYFYLLCDCLHCWPRFLISCPRWRLCSSYWSLALSCKFGLFYPPSLVKTRATVRARVDSCSSTIMMSLLKNKSGCRKRDNLILWSDCNAEILTGYEEHSYLFGRPNGSCSEKYDPEVRSYHFSFWWPICSHEIICKS